MLENRTWEKSQWISDITISSPDSMSLKWYNIH